MKIRRGSGRDNGGHPADRTFIAAGICARGGGAGSNSRLTFDLVKDLAAVLDRVIHFAEGVRRHQRVRQQQQRCDQQRERFLSNGALQEHSLQLPGRREDAFCHDARCQCKAAEGFEARKRAKFRYNRFPSAWP